MTPRIIIILCSIILAVTAGTSYEHGVEQYNYSEHRDAKRHLATGESEQDGDSCNKIEGCTFLNNTCGEDQSRLKEAYISPTLNTAYGHNANSIGYIYLKDYKSGLDLYPYANASQLVYEFGEWKIVVSPFTKVRANIKRNSASYEEIYMYMTHEDSNKYYTNKDFVICGQDDISYRFTNIGYIHVKVKMLSEFSNYSINLSFDDSSDIAKNKEDYTILIVSGIIGPIAVAGMIVILIFVIKRKPRGEKRKDISYVIKNMKTGNFSDLNILYDQKSGVICLAEFKSDSEVKIINECSHVFHEKGLLSWLSIVVPHQTLLCPHCNTPIKTSKRNETNPSLTINNRDALALVDENQPNNPNDIQFSIESHSYINEE